jgi:hypothetical protein
MYGRLAGWLQNHSRDAAAPTGASKTRLISRQKAPASRPPAHAHTDTHSLTHPEMQPPQTGCTCRSDASDVRPTQLPFTRCSTPALPPRMRVAQAIAGYGDGVRRRSHTNPLIPLTIPARLDGAAAETLCGDDGRTVAGGMCPRALPFRLAT